MRSLAWLVLIAIAALSSGAQAHPHAWIDVRSTVMLDAGGRAFALEEEWLFDEFYSLYLTNGASAKSAAAQAALDEVARVAIENLADAGYYTRVTADDAPVAIARASIIDAGARQNQFWLRMTLYFATPIDPRRQVLSFRIFHPGYYYEMLHLKGEPIAIQGGGGCLGRIEPPRPTAQAVALAAALDASATAPASFGELFAERVTIACK